MLAPSYDIKNQLYVDGIGWFRGSLQHLWPILTRLLQRPSQVFIIILYYGGMNKLIWGFQQASVCLKSAVSQRT